jgi:hypothetical protein
MSERIRIPPEQSLAGNVAALAAQWKANGSDTTFVRLLSYRADLAPAFFDFYMPLRGDGLVPARIKELARLRIARLNTCRY